MFVKVWEVYKEYNGFTNKQLDDLLMDKGYDELIEELGLAKENWDLLYKARGDEYKKPVRVFDDVGSLIQYLKQFIENFDEDDLPKEFVDSDCDGYDTCWITFYHVYLLEEKTPVIIYEEYYFSTNKYYGKYDPNTFATLGHKLEVWLWRE